jgi:acid phosphatase
MSRTKTLTVLSLLVWAGCCGPAPDPTGHAVAWMQGSAERVGLCRQAWRAAAEALPVALADPEWTAALEQRGSPGIGALPPAVVVDVDETVLDNMAYNARLLRDGAVFEPETWSRWVEERSAAAVPGALECLRAAAAEGVRVFYVTNRTAREEAATRDNLRALGFPLEDTNGLDVVLAKGERPDWAGSDKRTRREAVAATHRILLLCGDDLGDFLPDAKDRRAERVAEHGAWFGVRWFVLPNPVYGSWL